MELMMQFLFFYFSVKSRGPYLCDMKTVASSAYCRSNNPIDHQNVVLRLSLFLFSKDLIPKTIEKHILFLSFVMFSLYFNLGEKYI